MKITAANHKLSSILYVKLKKNNTDIKINKVKVIEIENTSF